MRGLIAVFVLVLLCAACNSQGLVRGSKEEEVPEETPVTEDPTPAPTATPADPVDPIATPLPTPVPCAFYGIGSGGDLWIIDPAAVTAQLVGNSNLQNTSDLAVTADGKMIVITLTAAYQLDPTNAQAYPYNSGAWVQGQNALDVTPDNRMLVGGGGALTFLGSGPQFDVLPFGSAAWSGDVAVMGDIAYGSALDNWDGPDHLIRIDLVTGSVAQYDLRARRRVRRLTLRAHAGIAVRGDPSARVPREPRERRGHRAGRSRRAGAALGRRGPRRAAGLTA